MFYALLFFIDSSSLDELERRLNAAEQKYIEANLEAKLKELEEAKQRQVTFFNETV